jgi:hypothetical protein
VLGEINLKLIAKPTGLVTINHLRFYIDNHTLHKRRVYIQTVRKLHFLFSGQLLDKTAMTGAESNLI